jgi:hypothetical protein
LAAITNAWSSIARAAHREDPVQLGEAQVVADRHTQLDAAGGVRQHDLLAGTLERGLPVDVAADLDVEHVDLAVDRLDLAVGADVHGGVGELLLAGEGLQERARDEVHAELGRGLPGPRDGRSVERLSRRAQLLL